VKYLIPVIVVLLMVSTSFAGVGTQVDEIRIDEKNQYKQLDYCIFLKNPDGTFYDTIDSPDIWIPKPKANVAASNLRTIISKSDDSKYEERFLMQASKGKTLYVGGSGPGNYTKIQDAIDDASDGDTVFVYDDSSPYYKNMVIDKKINLTGEHRETTVIGFALKVGFDLKVQFLT
jgi:hypothetical protein